MGGFECTDKLNAFGNRVDFINITGHLELLHEDYARLKQFGIKTVREGIRWSQVETKPYTYDWHVAGMMIDCARQHHIQQVWDLCHFGFPDDLTPLHPMFARRFAALCRAFIQYYRTKDPASTLIITPVNEVSFLSWLGGDARGTSPYCINMGWEVKYYLMRAYIEGITAMKEIDPSVRILTTEPLVNMVPPLNATQQQLDDAVKAHEHQFQVLDILAGRICRELGGRPEYLDILGFNYYYNNQWINGTGEFLPWANEGNDPRFKPLSILLTDCYERYKRPVVLTETSHPGEHRPNWIEKIGKEAAILLNDNIPLWGICLYPIIDRPDWDDLSTWHGSGLWDADMQHGPAGRRILYRPYADALTDAQQMIEKTLSKQYPVMMAAV